MATVIALSLKLLFPELRVVFDPRGFWPEEGVVEGKWREKSLTFRLWKKIEKYLFRRSEKVIALSESFADHVHDIHPQTNCAVIYTSVHVEKFKEARLLREQRRRELGFGDSKVFVYNGSLGSWHDPVLLAEIYRSLRQSLGDAKLLVITTRNKEKLSAVFHSNGLYAKEFLILMAKPDEVASFLAAADYGIVPLRGINKRGPMTVVADTMVGTKVAEYLASGLPIIVNQRVGGLRSLIAGYKIGLFFDSNDLQGMLSRFEDALKHYSSYQADCEQVADRYFSLDQVSRGYFEVYRQLAGLMTTAK
jgi:glycosyltransferase involved in cell wall biosynthesis